MPSRPLASPLLLPTIAALLLLAFAGCESGSSGAQVEATQTVTRGVTPKGRTLVFDGYNGSITLTDTSVQEADLTFTKRARASSREDARELLQKIQIEEQGNAQEYVYRLRSGASDRTSVDVSGSVPRNTRLRVTLRNGEVTLSGIGGPLKVDNENGDVRIGGAAGRTDARTRNGSVEVGMRRMPRQEDADVRLRTANGNLALTLPGNSSADVEARTSTGRIDLEGLRFDEQSLSQQGAGAHFEGQLGEGKTPVRLRTQNGSITLREGAVRRLPGVGAPSDSAARRDTARQDTTMRDSRRRDSLPGAPSPDTGTTVPAVPTPRTQNRPSDTSTQPPLVRPRDTTDAFY